MSVTINFERVVKKYDENVVVKNLSAKVEKGELFTLLGPSGCGKTTLLRMVAGFNSIEEGQISFDEQIINNIPAHKRNIGMVFQNYAIFPHMTVSDNVAYGLKMRKLSKPEMKKRVDDILKMVKIDDYKDRLPDKLSGGQQQRVALARAIVIHPKVLLMDEPLSNLDAKLRIEMRSAIRDIQKEVGITTIYVTHDQEEALAISDRIAVMKDGIIQQVGSPEAIFNRPQNVFVATFIGHSNLIKGVCHISGAIKVIELESGDTFTMDNLKESVCDGQKVIVSIRPNEFELLSGFEDGDAKNQTKGIEARVANSTFLGTYTQYQMTLKNGMTVDVATDLPPGKIQNGKVVMRPRIDKINIYTEDGTLNLLDQEV